MQRKKAFLGIGIFLGGFPLLLKAGPGLQKNGNRICLGKNCERGIPSSLLEEKKMSLESRAPRNPLPEKAQKNQKEISQGKQQKHRVSSKISQKDSPLGFRDHPPQPNETNLPSYYHQDRSDITLHHPDQVVIQGHSDPKLKGLKSGDVVWAVVEQEIVASPQTPSPIRAIALSGPFKGAFFLGEATLDRELKRVLFSFSHLRLKEGGDRVYHLRAAGLSPQGALGLEGQYVSQEGKFFVATLASAAASGFADATLRRSQNAWGNYVQEPSLANSGKAAGVSALSQTTERLAEKAKEAPEFTRVEGYQEIQVLIQADPTEG